MAKLIVKWITSKEYHDRRCPICISLEGYEWEFPIPGEFPLNLIHPTHGLVWDFSVDEPRTHGIDSTRGPWNCRCVLGYRPDLTEEIKKLQTIKKQIEDAAP